MLVGCVAALLLTIRKTQDRQKAMEERIQQLVEMNSRLRANRHDYLNNMQIVYGMLELNEYEELHRFLEPMYKDIMKISKALKTSSPAVNALLMAKMSEADKKDIDFYIEVKSNLKELSISDWELCRVLSNLIDNAFRATVESDNRGKKVFVDINEDVNNYFFMITDNGIGVPENIKNYVFKPGFTTKNEEGHGMGLYIVSKIVAKYHGLIELKNDNSGTCFTVTFSKSKKGGRK
jgi:sensor histidine kinase regulating citrate/malate metabolism